MPKLGEVLDQLVARVRQLPEARQRAAIEALRDIADEPYVLSDDELAVLLPALDDARLGQNLTDADTDDVLNKPWR